MISVFLTTSLKVFHHICSLFQIKNNTQFWEWMNEVFVGAIFASNWYNGQEEKVSEYIGNKRSILVGMPRLRQLRIMKSKS